MFDYKELAAKLVEFENEERIIFEKQTCPFPRYKDWCCEKNICNQEAYINEKIKAEEEWDKNYQARKEEFEAKLKEKRNTYNRLLKGLDHSRQIISELEESILNYQAYIELVQDLVRYQIIKKEQEKENK